MMLWILGWYALASITTFIVYAFDKRAAKRRTSRTPERTLHLLALFGGWPGALAAQRLLRHKNRKPKFGLMTAIIALGHFVAWTVWWLRFG